ncbi:hypothetical protein H2201_007059 [Coniosporium apollinis]|uniref:Subtilisin-like serine protease protein n=2 Tax=Coniosporium TaxID=2810619 RepID=A0ABQ9NKH9_9PEZI|nr:hypothetical protein H2199_008868 [Cladosporium sp. JES 115]KAJ9660152.1 hypothetical protein H2201_007059 [Coniosporium apollinis]
MEQIPFAAKDQLYRKLYITSDQLSIQRQPESVHAASTTGKSPRRKLYLPGQPRISLQDPNIGEYLESELGTRDLDKLAPHLWLVAKQDSSHMSSLTHKIVRGREIIVTEKPELHLVWIYNRVFIKPLPAYLLSHAFWEFYLVGGNSPISSPLKEDVRRAALGFLRSYLYLIQHKSDFILATDEKLRLIPKKISYSDFVNFIIAFDKLEDTDVAPRYHFGELRLSRLNFWSKVFLRRFTYHKVHGQYGAHIAEFYGPILFLFGALSVAMAAMQLALAGQRLTPSGLSWIRFARVTHGFSIYALFCVALVVLLLVFTTLSMGIRETAFALNDLYHKKRASAQQTGVSTRKPQA